MNFLDSSNETQEAIDLLVKGASIEGLSFQEKEDLMVVITGRLKFISQQMDINAELGDVDNPLDILQDENQLTDEDWAIVELIESSQDEFFRLATRYQEINSLRERLLKSSAELWMQWVGSNESSAS